MHFFIARLFILSLVIFMPSCVTLSSTGKMVRTNNGRPSNCQFLGNYEASHAFGNNMADDRIQARKKIQNKIGKDGGNTMVEIDSGGDLLSSTIQAEGYKCQLSDISH